MDPKIEDLCRRLKWLSDNTTGECVKNAYAVARLMVMQAFEPPDAVGSRPITKSEMFGFTCPSCGGHHFGTSWPKGMDAKKARVQCHDQFAIGCRWEGPYLDHVQSIADTEQITSRIKAIARAVAREEISKATVRSGAITGAGFSVTPGEES